MKSILKSKFKFMIILLLVFSCAEDTLLDNPPVSDITVDSFFQTDDQLMAVGASLYSTPWFYYNYRLLHTMEAYAGNAMVESGDYAGFRELNVNALNGILYEGYFSLWWAVANANSLLDNLENRVGDNVTEAALNRARGEALVARAIAYFQIVQTWGAVPILEDIRQYETNELVFKNRVEDVYTFIIRDLEEATSLLPETRQSDGRASKQVANAYLAKVHLTNRNYDQALAKSVEVIESGQFALLPNYEDLFVEDFDNSEESIFALQWLACQGWGQGNAIQAWTAPFGSNITKVDDGWGTYKVAQDLIEAYEEGDERRYLTVMEENNFYPELNTVEGGYSHTGTPHFRKYVVGSPDEGNVCRMSTGNNTYLMRYAEILLIHAEAVLGNNIVTTDGDALNSFNTVRARAGLDPLTEITFDDILHERRVELAFEGVYWYDLARMEDRQLAISMLLSQNRGTEEQPFRLTSVEPEDFLLPMSQIDVDKNPNLGPTVDPVPYDFNK